MIRLYNTLTRQTEELRFPSGEVKLYVCGVTPYDTSHLGHARVGVVYDALRRFLESQDLRVRYVQNVTDIDEPLFERARRDGVDWRVLGEQQTRRYLDVLARIKVEQPEFYVRATSVIPHMQQVIARLLELGHAYVVDGAVYFSVATDPHFGEIAHADYKTMLAMANDMGNQPDDPRKRDPLDFVLWQPSAPDEPAWPSPWGDGRPGWHIECSTMATEYLGPQVDIHGGGADLIFPHHACEIAQAEPASGVRPFVHTWMHTGLVSLDGTKMSKSLGNMVFVEDVLERFSPAALRLAILSYPYAEPFEYSEGRVVECEEIAGRVRAAFDAVGHADAAPVDATQPLDRFQAALTENFDTPAAIEIMDQLATTILRAAREGSNVRPAQAALQQMTNVLGY